MKTSEFNLKKMIVLGSASVFTMLAMPLIADVALGDANVFVTAAHAADDATQKGSGQGKQGEGSGGQQKGGMGGAAADASAGGGQAGAGSSGSGQGSQGGKGGASTGASKPTESVTTTTEVEGGKGQMGSGVHGQGSYQDSKQKGGGSAPGPGGINNEPNDAKGPRFSGGAGTGSSGGKPAWAQEGLPQNPDGTEVELGRLNVARAPGKLLDKQLLEATVALTELVVNGGSLYQAPSLDAAIALISQDVVRVDSPLGNLALLKDFASDGVLDGDYVTADGTTYMLLDPTMTDAEFVSLLLGSAADKLVPITEGTVGAMEVLLGVDLGDNAAIAAMADQVRQAILDAHED